MSERICVVPKVSGIGGMVSFLNKFTLGARDRGIEVTNDLDDQPYKAILVIGGTKAFLKLAALRLRGIKVVQRLDGINWIHRVKPTGLKHSLRAEYGNFVLSIIRRFIASEIIYQSEFSRIWWNKRFGEVNKPFTVIHNGVDTDIYAPTDPAVNEKLGLLVVEGSMGGGYDDGLRNAVALCDGLREKGVDIELRVVGEVSEALKNEWNAKTSSPIKWRGVVAREEIPAIMADADLFFSADIHPACPNAVIEALSCGLPVLAFITGSLSELVGPDRGRVVPYGSDPWKLEEPNIQPLVEAAFDLLKELPNAKANARKWAETHFSLDLMVQRYLKILLG